MNVEVRLGKSGAPRPLNVTGGGQAAFSLAEVLVAIMLSGLTAASVFSAVTSAISLLNGTRQELRATQLLQDKMEAIRLYSWDQLNTPGFVPTSFTAPLDPGQTNSSAAYTGSVLITNCPGITAGYSTNMRQVTITVNWPVGQGSHQRSMTTYVARYGIQNYLY